ncbi:substrate-binding domain-containing protein [Curtobacterium sp. MCBD17_028]|uniref:substrate-binding domain-containing protein n=1 Tax=Curtobacterium sp. MCBD17_028 TaxID=2175670 RepID=UPI000DAA1980|nr:substrate-binding domain-containing protein [Curtobacterium sp. MCBD17_028]PZE26067.1 sugar ABC transporter substrate-binding protein [Curtobacterium sp. MCBD17_028]
MNSSRRIAVSAVIGLAAVTALAGCDATSTTASSGSTSSSKDASSSTLAAGVPAPTGVPTACKPKSGDTFKIGVVDIDEQTSFFTQMNTGIQAVAKKAGASVQLVSGNDDAATQVSGIENLTSSGVDAIIVDPYDANALVPALKAAKAKGIAVVSTDGSVADASAIDTQVGTANTVGGQQLGKAFLTLSGGKGEVGVVAALNSSIQIQRQDGFQDTVKAGGMTIKAVVDGQNVNDKAQTAAENLLTAHPDLEYIYATGSPALDGAIAAVRSQGKTGSTQIVGWDLDSTSAAGIKQGFVKEVVQQDTYGFGYAAAKAAIDLACGGTKVPATISVPTTIVTKANLAKYDYFLKG